MLHQQECATAYVDPTTVTSPLDKLQQLEVIYNGGESGWSVAKFLWSGKAAAGVRWNGGPDDKVGNPQSRGKPTWFVLPSGLAPVVMAYALGLRAIEFRCPLTYSKPPRRVACQATPTARKEMAAHHDVANSIVAHLEKHAQRVADVVVWPRREVWFNTEAFVAVSTMNTNRFTPEWLLWGEQSYITTTRELGLPDPAPGDAKNSPDMFFYEIDSKGGTHGRGVAEAKIIYVDDLATSRAKTTPQKLNEQRLRARRILPNKFALGMVYLVHSGPPRPRQRVEDFFDDCAKLIASECPTAINLWGTGVVRPTGLQEITTTTVYPSTTVSIAIAAVVIV